MKIGMNPSFRIGNLGSVLRPAKVNPFPDIIGTFMGRDALSLVAAVLEFGSDDTVLLPAFICREVVKPFLRKGCVEFYDLPFDLSVDPDQIEARLAQGKVKAVVIINYFGFLQSYRRRIKQLCADRGVILIEDCAHSLLTEGSGETGDFSVYSFRKTLPVPDGGGLRVNIEKKIAPLFYPRSYSNFLSTLVMAKLILDVRTEALSRAGLTSRKKSSCADGTSSKESKKVLPLSSFTYNGLGNISFSETREKRRADFQFWMKVVERNDLVEPIFADLPLGVCPLGFPIRVKDRDSLKSRFQAEGINPEIHWHLPETVGTEFINSHRISEEELTLPIYPKLSLRDRKSIERLLVA